MNMTTMALATARMPILSTASSQSYLDSVQAIPILTREEEVELFQDFQLHENLEAARTLVLSHLRYVAYIARSYIGYGLPLEDLICLLYTSPSPRDS